MGLLPLLLPCRLALPNGTSYRPLHLLLRLRFWLPSLEILIHLLLLACCFIPLLSRSVCGVIIIRSSLHSRPSHSTWTRWESYSRAGAVPLLSRPSYPLYIRLLPALNLLAYSFASLVSLAPVRAVSHFLSGHYDSFPHFPSTSPRLHYD